MAVFPQGTVVQTERGTAHQQFVETARPQYVLLKINYARQLVKRGLTAEDHFPKGVSVITSTAIRDGVNAALPLEGNDYKMGEWDIVEAFEPDFHIPTDRSDYFDFSDEKRYERIRECMKGTLAMANHVAERGLSTTILPWLKGVTREERWLTYRTIEQLGMDYVAFYANGYFNGRDGNYRRELIEDLEYLVDEATALLDHTDEIEVFVLNCQSPMLLERMPAAVVASSGLWVGQNRRWRKKVTPTTQSAEEVRKIFDDVDERVQEALGVGREEQDPPRQRGDTPSQPETTRGDDESRASMRSEGQ